MMRGKTCGVLAAALLLTGCGSAAAPASAPSSRTSVAPTASAAPAASSAPALSQVTIKLGDTSSLAGIASWMALDNNLFGQYGLTVSRTPVTGGPGVAMPATVSGDFDVWNGPADAYIVFCTRQPGECPLQSAATLTHNIGVVLYAGPDSGVKTAAELKGKTIGISRKGSSTDFQLAAWLQKKGLKAQTDVKVIAVGGSDSALAALSNNQIQAQTLIAPLTFQAQRLGMSPISDFSKELGDYEGALTIVRRSFVQQHRDTLTAYVKALIEGLAMARSNEAAALAAAAKYSGISDPAVLKPSYEANKPFLAWPPSASKAGYSRILSVLRTLSPEYGIRLKAEAQPEDFYTDDIVQELGKSGFVDQIAKKYGLPS